MSSDSQPAANLISLGVPTLHEANHRRGLMAGMRVLVGDSFSGRAQTVALPAGDNLGIHLAMAQAERGFVLCVASAGKGLYGVGGELRARHKREDDMRQQIRQGIDTTQLLGLQGNRK